jgi:hypothetical protein
LLEKKQTKEKNKMSIQKELDQANKQVAITKDNLINDIDVFFYDIENIEDQAKVFRMILSQFSNYDLEAIREYVKISTNKKAQ